MNFDEMAREYVDRLDHWSNLLDKQRESLRTDIADLLRRTVAEALRDIVRRSKAERHHITRLDMLAEADRIESEGKE